MTWQLATLLTIIFWGTAQVLIKKGFSYLTPWQTFAVDTIIALAIWLPFGLWRGEPVNLGILPILLSLFFGIAVGLYYYVIEKGPLTITQPLFSASPAFTVLFSAWFLKEALTASQIGSILLTLVGVILVTTPFARGPLAKGFRTRLWIYLAFILALAWGIEGTATKYLVASFGNATYLILLGIGQLTAVILWYLFRQPKRLLPEIPKRYIFPTFAGVLLYNVGTITYASAFEHGYASIVQTLTTLSILVTIVLSVLYLKERLTRHQIVGILITLFGAALIGYTTV